MYMKILPWDIVYLLTCVYIRTLGWILLALFKPCIIANWTKIQAYLVEHRPFIVFYYSSVLVAAF